MSQNMSRSQSPCRRSNADPAEDEEPMDEVSNNIPVVESDKTTFDNREFILPFRREFYKVPGECIKYDGRTPLPVKDGAAAYSLHESKSFPVWKKAEVSPKHLVQLEANDTQEQGEEEQVGWYVTFKIGSSETADIYTLRPVHKSIAGKLHTDWSADGLSEKKKSKYAGLLKKAPSQCAQINPLFQHWKLVEAPKNMLYTRPKKESTKGTKRALEDEDDAASSATTNKNTLNTLAVAPHHNRQEIDQGPVFGSGAPNIFMQTPGMVSISEAYLRELLKNQNQR